MTQIFFFLFFLKNDVLEKQKLYVEMYSLEIKK